MAALRVTIFHARQLKSAYLLPLLNIYEQHLEEASMLAVRRNLLVGSAAQKLDSLAELDDRINAHLEGLYVDAENAYLLCERTLEFGEASEVFVGALAALASGNPGYIQEMNDVACATPSTRPGLISALGWLPYARVASFIQSLSASEITEQRYVATAAQAIHRVSDEWVQRALNDKSALVQARACRAIGELGRVDLVPQLRAQQQSKDDAVAFWSCWSAAVLGDVSAATLLKRFATAPDHADDALAVGLRRLPPHAAKAWIEELAQDEANVRSVIQGVAIVGDPAFVPGLIAMMSVKDLARIAAESFCAITGVNLAEQKLEVLAPAPANEEEETAIDPDEFLPWPDAARVSAWWDKNAAQFSAGTRYLLGKTVTPEHLQWVLRYGNQKLRHGAALELSMLAPGTPIFNISAPAWIQQKLLGLTS